MTDRVQRLNFVALSIVIVYAMSAVRFVSATPIVNPAVDSIAVFLTSVGFYKMVVQGIFLLVSKTRFLLKLYWGRFFVDGLWSYTYTLDGQDDGVVYFGVWRFEQTLFQTSVVGFGLTDNFLARSRVWSITDMMSDGGACEIINKRTDAANSANTYYSRTTMYFELGKGRIIRHPIRMRGHTIVYGGPLNGRVCNNMFARHENAQTEQDVVDQLQRSLAAHGQLRPGGDLIWQSERRAS